MRKRYYYRQVPSISETSEQPGTRDTVKLNAVSVPGPVAISSTSRLSYGTIASSQSLNNEYP